jgi:hypothetical protein
LTILGAITTLLGFFVMFGNESSSIGLGGAWSWEVGEIPDGWMFSLLVAGGVLLIGALVLALAGRNRTRVESSPLSNLVQHAVIFTVVNAFIWMQAYALEDGLDYAYWVTVPWGIGLVIHIATYRASRSKAPLVVQGDAPQELVEDEQQH